MNKKEEVLVEMYKKSLDSIMVHNITDNDFVLVYDRAMTNTKHLIPHKGKDVGHGRGNMVLPRYLAEKFVDKMIKSIIIERSEREWEKVKDKYRMEERSSFEERYALRTNNKELWAELFPQMWLGVVQKYGGDDIQELEETNKVQSRNLIQDMQSELGLGDKEYEAQVENAKASLVKDISEK